MLLSPRNAGLRTFRRQVVGEGGWPAIVDREIWQAVTDRLSDPGRRYGPSRARRHLLSNIAVCGACGNGLGSGVNSRGALIYTCKACNRVSRNGAWLDAIAVEATIDRLSRPDAAELLPVVGCAESAELRWVNEDQVGDLRLHPGLANSWQKLRGMLTLTAT